MLTTLKPFQKIIKVIKKVIFKYAFYLYYVKSSFVLIAFKYVNKHGITHPYEQQIQDDNLQIQMKKSGSRSFQERNLITAMDNKPLLNLVLEIINPNKKHL